MASGAEGERVWTGAGMEICVRLGGRRLVSLLPFGLVRVCILALVWALSFFLDVVLSSFWVGCAWGCGCGFAGHALLFWSVCFLLFWVGFGVE